MDIKDLFKFDTNKVTDNNAFQLGMNILGNNYGHYGELNPALGGGLRDYQRQRSLMAQQNRANSLAQYRNQEAQRAKQEHEYKLKQREANTNTMAKFRTANPKYANLPDQTALEMYKTANKPAPLPTGMRLNQATGQPEMIPAYAQHGLNKAKASASKTTVDLSGNEADKAWGKAKIGRIETGINSLAEGTTGARQTEDYLTRLEAILADPEFETGPWENSKYKIQNLMNSAGLPISYLDKFSKAQEFQAGSGELVRQLLNEATGPQTDTDKIFLETITPSLGKTKGTNKSLISFSQSRLKLNKYFSKKMSDLYGVGKSSDAVTQYNPIEQMYKDVPASVITPKGNHVHFIDYYRMAKKTKQSDDEIVQNWFKNTRGM